MEFLNSISLKEMESMCYEDDLDMFKEIDNVGKWLTSLQKSKDEGIFEFNLKLNVEVDDVNSGAETTARLTQNLTTIQLKKYEFCRNSDRDFNQHTSLYLDNDGTYHINKVAYENKVLVDKKSVILPREKAYGFISEAGGIILQRVLSVRRSRYLILNFWTLDHNLDMCDVYYETFDVIGKRLPSHLFDVFVIQGEIDYTCAHFKDMREDKKVIWKSYYNLIGRLVHYNEKGSPIYGSLPKASKETERKLYSNLTEKYGSRYLRTITKDDLKDLLFSETKSIHYGNNKGHLKVTVERSSFREEPCILMLVNMLLKTPSGLTSYTISAHLDYQLLTLEYQEFSVVRTEHGILYRDIKVFRNSEKQVGVKMTIVKGSEVTREKQFYSEKDFDDFVCPASILLLQRLLSKRKFKETVYFKSLLDDTKLCTLIFKPIDPKFFCHEKFLLCPTFGVECALIPFVGDISIWRSYFLIDHQLAMSKEITSNVEIRSMNRYLEQPCPEIDCFTHVPIYDNGCEFLQSITLDDIFLVCYNEVFTIKSGEGIEVGLIDILVEYEKDAYGNLLICVQCCGKIQEDEDISRHIYLYGKLTPKLETLEQVVEKTSTLGEVEISKSFVQVKKDDTGYKLYGSNGQNFYEKHIDSSTSNLTFVSDAAEIIIERLLFRKHIIDTLYFFNVDNNLKTWTIKYSPIMKKWKKFQGHQLEMFGIQRTICSSQELESSDHCFYANPGFCLERHIFSLASELEYVFEVSKVVTDKKEINLSELYLFTKPIETNMPMVDKVVESDGNLGPEFSWHIDEREVKYIVFSEDLSIFSKEEKKIGSCFVVVSHAFYQREWVFLVQTYRCVKDVDTTYGVNMSAYISFDLDILEYSRFEFCDATAGKSENLLLICRDNDMYKIAITNSANSVAKFNFKLWIASKQFPYVCDATLIIVQRLMIIRNIGCPLHLLGFDIKGDKIEITLVPEQISFMNIGENVIETMGMQKILHHPEHANVKAVCSFSRSGYIIEEFQEGTNEKIVNTHILNSTKATQIPKSSSIYSPTLIPANSSSIHVLQSFSPKDITDIIKEDNLYVMSEKNIQYGSFSSKINHIYYKDKLCILLQTKLVYKSATCVTSVSTSDILSFKLQVLKHYRADTSEEDYQMLKKKLSIEKSPQGTEVKYSSNLINEDVTFHVKTDADGLMTAASHLLFQKIMAKKKITGKFRFVYISSDAVICKMTVNCIGNKMVDIDGNTEELFCVETSILPYKSSLVSRSMYFDKEGSLCYSKSENIGTKMCLKRMILPGSGESEHLKTEYKFRKFYKISDFDNILLNDYAHIIYGGNRIIGDNFVSVAFVHYQEQPCFKVRISNMTHASSCITNVEALISEDLHTLSCTVHKYFSSESSSFDCKFRLTQKYGAYVIEKLDIHGKKASKHEVYGLLCHTLPRFGSQALDMILMKLMVLNRVTGTIEIDTFNEETEVYGTKYHCFGIKKILVSDLNMNAWKISIEAPHFAGKSKICDYYFSSDAHLLSCQEYDVPMLTIVPLKLARKYQKSELQLLLSSTNLQQKITEYFKNHNDVFIAFEDFLNALLWRKPPNVAEMAASYFSKVF